MVKKAQHAAQNPGVIDVACLIHGDAYSWDYVERLYRMVTRFAHMPVRFHVYTEPTREVPEHMIRHDLIPWPGIHGPKKSWWYKMQMFDPRHHEGTMLYFDLDVVIVNDINWICQSDRDFFWAVRDFKYLWRSNWGGLNSSIMLWDVSKYGWIWTKFSQTNLYDTVKKYHGDQDFLSEVIDRQELRFFDIDLVKSWRWQIKDGGMEFSARKYHKPGMGTIIDEKTCVMIFHGNPKPHELNDSVIAEHWS